METYKPEEVKNIIKMLKSVKIKTKKNKDDETFKLEKQIRYLEQRFKFFNPTKKMIGYIIDQTKRSKTKLDSDLLKKLEDEFDKKLR